MFRDNFGCTPLHYVALQSENKAADCIEPLLDYANLKEDPKYFMDLIGHKDKWGRTLFHLACISGSCEILTNFCQMLNEQE